MFPPSAISTNAVAASPPMPPCEYGRPSDGFRLRFLSGDAAVPPADSDCVHVWSHPLTGPARSGFRDLLSEEECAAASCFHTPELAERYRQAHGWMRSVPVSYTHLPAVSSVGTPVVSVQDVLARFSHERVDGEPLTPDTVTFLPKEGSWVVRDAGRYVSVTYDVRTGEARCV